MAFDLTQRFQVVRDTDTDMITDTTLDLLDAFAELTHERLIGLGICEDDLVGYLSLKLSGEAGEVSNIVGKKLFETIGDDYHSRLEDELADVLIFWYIMAEHLQIDIDKALHRKLELFRKKLEMYQLCPR